jgi:hypothetical protein
VIIIFFLEKAKCIFDDTLRQDSGKMTYPPLREGKRQQYSDAESCIWHISTKTPNQNIKFRFTYVNLEHDSWCSLDRVYIHPGNPHKNGYIDDLETKSQAIGRICGGGVGNGPKRQHNSMVDGMTKLTRFAHWTCPDKAKKNKKTGKFDKKPCKQHGFDDWVQVESPNVTFAFDSDGQNQNRDGYKGFSIEWDTWPAPKPTPPPPDYSKLTPLLSRQQSRDMITRAISMAPMKRFKNQNRKIIQRTRAKQEYQRITHLVEDQAKNLPKWCNKFTEIVPLPLGDMQRALADVKPWMPDAARQWLLLELAMLEHAFGGCYWKVNKFRRYEFHNKVHRLIHTIYNIPFENKKVERGLRRTMQGLLDNGLLDEELISEGALNTTIVESSL